MKTISSTTGYLVEELEEGIDTEDLELVGLPIDTDADRWEQLAEIYASGEHCAACPFDDRGVNVFTGRPWRECAALHWSHCPGINPKSIANALRRQAS